jgi:Na+-translocating ferredoxin:NAD+ oxidoreductase RNF subunit RnfB
MTNVIICVAVLLIMGAVFGAVLAYAAKVFAVEKDPREEAIVECLPGANCGGCGYPGCSGYASAVVAGNAGVNSCAAGGEAVAAKIAEIMGVAAGASVKQIAAVHCTGCGVEHTKYNYQGISDCLSASRLPGGGPLGCDFGCLGMGTCEKVCPFDAIHVKGGVAVVDEEKCKACSKCVDACPRHLIALEPYKTKKHVAIPCSSKAKGPVVTKVCGNGCIGCSLCAKACPKEAITVDSFLAKIDYDKCVGCGICAQKCPRHLITVDGVVPEVKPVAPKAPAAAPAAPKAEEAPKAAPVAEEAPKAE